MSGLKRYPDWNDFDVDETMYGLHAPFVGMGTYTVDGKFSWPDRECTTKEEYLKWAEHLEKQGYAIPEEYLNAYVETKEMEP